MLEAPEVFSSMDAVALYGMSSEFRPQRFVEVGSGYSTKFARRAIHDHSLRTRITSIDPAPRAEIDKLCDCVIRRPLEELDLSVFDELEPGIFCSSTVHTGPFQIGMSRSHSWMCSHDLRRELWCIFTTSSCRTITFRNGPTAIIATVPTGRLSSRRWRCNDKGSCTQCVCCSRS